MNAVLTSEESTPTGSASRMDPDRLAALVRAARAGDDRALEQLIQHFAGLVRAVARAHRLSEDDAADVAQTTWLRAVEHIERLREPEKIAAWIGTTARRECLRVIRTGARELPAVEGTFDRQVDETPIDAGLVRAERDSALWRAFNRLSARDQTLLHLLLAEPTPSYESIGEALQIPIGSIGPTRGRCLERLRRELKLPAAAWEAA